MSLPPTVHLLSNPASFSIGGVEVAVGGHDVIWDLNKTVVARGVQQNKVINCAQHILEQQSFFPIFPPCNHVLDGATPLNVSMDYVRCAEMKFGLSSPHLLVLPSMVSWKSDT